MVKWGVIGVVALFVVVYFGSAFGYRGDCVRAEAGIKAQYKANQSSYDAMWKTFKEMAQVPEMYVADMRKVWDGAIQGRYGAEGSKAVFQFIKEHNPTLDPSLYTRLQSAIEAGRNRFNADQQQLLAKKQAYEVVLEGNRGAVVGMWFGFPKIDLDEYDIVTSDQTAEAFATKKAAEVKLRDE
ncbi:hypothetical protein HY480_04650 [Candidatus Uhrbacteria bacterium]|nr:hypothetical protein [Candidatus Uhrbacteria bacterium]